LTVVGAKNSFERREKQILKRQRTLVAHDASKFSQFQATLSVLGKPMIKQHRLATIETSKTLLKENQIIQMNVG
jgi:hypothetical protein